METFDIEFEDGELLKIPIIKTFNRLKNLKLDKKVKTNSSIIKQLKEDVFELDVSTYNIIYIYHNFINYIEDKTEQYEVDSLLSSIYGCSVINLDEDKKIGLFLNIPKISALRSLEQINAIGTAISGNKDSMKNLLIMSGRNEKEVHNLISKSVSNELHQKHLDK